MKDKTMKDKIKNNDIDKLYNLMMNEKKDNSNSKKIKKVVHELYRDITIYEDDSISIYNIGDWKMNNVKKVSQLKAEHITTENSRYTIILDDVSRDNYMTKYRVIVLNDYTTSMNVLSESVSLNNAGLIYDSIIHYYKCFM